MLYAQTDTGSAKTNELKGIENANQILGWSHARSLACLGIAGVQNASGACLKANEGLVGCGARVGARNVRLEVAKVHVEGGT